MEQWKPRITLITCPVAVLDVWERQIEEHYPGLYDVTVARGTPQRKKWLLERALAVATVRPVIIVVNHESVWRAPFGDALRTDRIDLLVVDEAHRAKAPAGKFSRFLGRLRDSCRYRLALSGTPLPHSPLDAYAQYRFLDPVVFGQSNARFKARYAIMGGFNGKQVMGYQNMDEFSGRLEKIMFSCKKEDCLDLPEELDEVRRCDLEPAARKVYQSLEQDFWAAVGCGEVTAANALVKLLRLQQVTSGDLPVDDTAEEVSRAKSALLADVLLDVPVSQPVVVFCRFRQDLLRCSEVARGLGRRYGEVSGSRKDLERGLYPAGVDLLGVQIQSGGVGVDLTRASLSVFYSLGFNLGDYLQARARLHRPGQSHKVTHMHLIARDTVDEAVLGALRSRRAVVEAILEKRLKPREERDGSIETIR
jgi:SNF2 family DNA or RNA helicase